MFFASDNGAPVHPSVLNALSEANTGYAGGYGADALSLEVEERIRTLFEAPEAQVFLLPTGTAANALALATICQPWQTIYCHRNAHIEEDEAGAPEFYTNGAKITLVEGEHGLIDPALLSAVITNAAASGVHNVQRGCLSITTATECGTVYSLDQLKTLTSIAAKFDMPCHLDGARFANALIKLGCSPAEMTWKAGIDILSFGGTKNGLMGVEAVVIFDPKTTWEFELRRKRGGHLFSKHRYLAAQFKAYLDNDLWLTLARQANASAQTLLSELASVDNFSCLHPVDANLLFVEFPRALHRNLAKAKAQYYFWPFNQTLEGPDHEMISARLVCSWSTTQDDIRKFIGAIHA
ncbi:L-threonine aldolase [Amylibacter marinus]|uniref:L-threonine aldolase n=1 Tax=Amylibacter marinus TaxID=1475483 RepID=A0ABQ5VXV2_9RHOB|nr:beta-eliminating lyase-related protein [Amylibacter marinus]GLQ36066.1 L-threonine aldolase [Amylibacter marinus]